MSDEGKVDVEVGASLEAAADRNGNFWIVGLPRDWTPPEAWGIDPDDLSIPVRVSISPATKENQ